MIASTRNASPVVRPLGVLLLVGWITGASVGMVRAEVEVVGQGAAPRWTLVRYRGVDNVNHTVFLDRPQRQCLPTGDALSRELLSHRSFECLSCDRAKTMLYGGGPNSFPFPPVVPLLPVSFSTPCALLADQLRASPVFRLH